MTNRDADFATWIERNPAPKLAELIKEHGSYGASQARMADLRGGLRPLGGAAQDACAVITRVRKAIEQVCNSSGIFQNSNNFRRRFRQVLLIHVRDEARGFMRD